MTTGATEMEAYIHRTGQRGGNQWHGSPVCRCGSRNTRRIGESALIRQCQSCGSTYKYRLRNGLLVPFDLRTAEALEEQ